MFELSDELIRQIIFAMENQNIRYVVDTQLGVLVRADSVPAGEQPEPDTREIDITLRYQELPRWTSADGFQLMERFLSELHNPVARNTLQEILLSGKRVFRRFKDTIREYPEVEKRYHRHKYLEMRRLVLEWHAQLREIAGLDAQEIGVDQEVDDLVSTEITIAPITERAPVAILDLDERAFAEAHPELDPDLREHLYRERRRGYKSDPGDPRSTVYGAFNPLEELCGFLWVFRDHTTGGADIRILQQLYVFPEYRGLGIATSLLEHCIRNARQDAVAYVWSRLPGIGPPVSALLRHAGFDELRRDYLLTL